MKISRINFVACHRRPERSFFHKGKQYPVCARCTGIMLGFLFFPLLLFRVLHIGFWPALLLNVPAALDGITQAAGWRLSNNALRFVTGLLSGIGQIALITMAGTQSGLWVLRIIKG